MDLEHQLLDEVERMYQMLDRKMAYYIRENNPTDLTHVQAIVLQYIMVESRKRDVFSKDLEEFFNIKSSSVSSMLNHLEKGGYIRRETTAEDGRMKRLVLMPKSREIEEWLCGVIDDHIYQAFDGFSQEEMENLSGLLRKMMKNLEI